MAKRKQIILSAEEHLNNELNALRKQHIRVGDPTIFHSVGDAVVYGGYTRSRVSEIYDSGRFYLLCCEYDREGYQEITTEHATRICVWSDVCPIVDTNSFAEKELLHVDYSSSDVDAVIHKYYHFGINMEPDYQRDLVWTPEQEENLIHSIFTNVDIGKMTFRHCGYTSDFMYEIIDGKQRLNTLLKFYEGRIRYKGKTIFELNRNDRRHFLGHRISSADLRNVTQKQVYDYFIKLNVSGTRVADSDLDRVRKLKDAL